MTARQKYSEQRRKRRTVSIGDLDERINLQTREIQSPLFATTHFTETFTSELAIWAAINSVHGQTFFDGVSTDKVVSHHIFIRYDSNVTVTAETWVLSEDNRRFDILDVNNLDDRNEFLMLICALRGPTSKAAAEA